MKKLLMTTSVLACLAGMTAGQAARAADWPMFGQNLNNTADGMGERTITVKNVSSLKPKWVATTAGSWSALDPATGNILWQVPDPNGSIDLGPMAVAGGLVYAGSMAGGAGQLNMFALDAATSKVLWSYASGGSVISGATISGGVVYWGSGYSNLGAPYTGNTKFYAFSINGQ